MDRSIHGEYEIRDYDTQRRTTGSRSGSGGLLLSPIGRDTLDTERRSILDPIDRLHDGSIAIDMASIGKLDSLDGMGSVSEKDADMHPIQHMSYAGKEFNNFLDACHEIERDIVTFTHEVQKLGSTFRLVIGSRDLHARLGRVREFFKNNALPLGVLPDKIKTTKSKKQAKKMKKRFGNGIIIPAGGSLHSEEDLDAAHTLVKLADSVKEFTIAIVDFEDYTDEDGLNALRNFEIELRVLSGGLDFFSPDGPSVELRKFVTARAISLTSHLKNLSKALDRFKQIGIPCISYAQKRSSKMLLNASTIATFFAGVAATTLQYSIVSLGNKREVAMNTLWFASLVLAIGAAMTGMLAMTWRSAVFSSPKRQLPWYIRFWVRSGYLALLVASVITFLVGLVIYVFDIVPAPAGWIILALTVFCFLGLVAVILLFFKERITFSQVRNKMRRDLNRVHWELLYSTSEGGWIAWAKYHFLDQLRKRKVIFVHRPLGEPGSPNGNRNGNSPYPENGGWRRLLGNVLWFWNGRQDPEAAIENDGYNNQNKKRRKSLLNMRSRHGTDASKRSGTGGGTNGGGRGGPSDMHRQYSENDPNKLAKYKERIGRLGLYGVSNTDSRAFHLQYSPNGRWLVICYKYECNVYDVEAGYVHHDTLRHIQKKARQVEWSPDGTRLITRTSEFVKLWYIDEADNDRFVQEKVISLDVEDEISDVQWLNDSVFLAIADEETFFRVDISGDRDIKTEYKFGLDSNLLELYYLYTMPDSELVLIVAARKIEGLPEDVSIDKSIDCIIIYEMDKDDTSDTHSLTSRSTWRSMHDYGKGRIRKRIPLLHDVESLSFGSHTSPDFSGNRRRMVISYLDKPPEMWTISVSHENKVDVHLEKELVKKREFERVHIKEDEDAEWGDAFLIGPLQNIVACAEDGIVHFWDLESDSLLNFHTLTIVNENDKIEELPVVSWVGPQYERNVPTMATAGKGLPLKIWTPGKSYVGGTTNNDSREGEGAGVENRYVRSGVGHMNGSGAGRGTRPQDSGLQLTLSHRNSQMNSNENENEDFNEKGDNEEERGVEEREYEIPVLQTAESDNSRPVRPMVVISSLGQSQGRSEQSGDYFGYAASMLADDNSFCTSPEPSIIDEVHGK